MQVCTYFKPTILALSDLRIYHGIIRSIIKSSHNSSIQLCSFLYSHFPTLCRHQEYIVDGVTYMRLKFYVDGSKMKGTATIDLRKVAF